MSFGLNTRAPGAQSLDWHHQGCVRVVRPKGDKVRVIRAFCVGHEDVSFCGSVRNKVPRDDGHSELLARNWKGEASPEVVLTPE